MRRFALLASVTAFALAACSSEAPETADSGEEVSMEEVAERAKESAIKPEPGQYRVTMEVLEVDVPGAPEGAADMMRGMMAGRSHSYCLTQEDVEKGFEQMARNSQEDDNCSFQRFDIDGGDFDAKMTCDAQGQGTMTMTMKGKGTPTSSEVEMTMKGNMTGMGDSTIRMKASHERTGDCG